MKQTADVLTANISALVTKLLWGFTHHHQDLKVIAKKMGSIIAVSIQGHADDQPRLVGQNGRHYTAMAKIMEALSRRVGLQIVLSLQEPHTGVKGDPRKFVSNPKWKPDETRALLKETVASLFQERCQISEHHDTKTSIFQITPHRIDKPRFSADLEEALKEIFDAIGKTNGRTIIIAGIERRN